MASFVNKNFLLASFVNTNFQCIGFQCKSKYPMAPFEIKISYWLPVQLTISYVHKTTRALTFQIFFSMGLGSANSVSVSLSPPHPTSLHRCPPISLPLPPSFPPPIDETKPRGVRGARGAVSVSRPPPTPPAPPPLCTWASCLWVSCSWVRRIRLKVT
jgi:hypothetical protein